MRHFLSAFTITVAVLLAGTKNANAQETPYAEGELLVQLNPGVDIQVFLDNHKDIRLVAKELLWSELRIWWLTFDGAQMSSQSALNSIKADRGVNLAQLNHYVTERSITPNDTRFVEQWALNNTGQTGGTPDADIDAPEAWDITTGGTTVTGDQIVVAIIDVGFDLNHADISFFKNTHETPGNGVDDDGNGYIDDYDGWNAYNNTGTIPPDQFGHGTHVAGIAAARGNNSTGVSGVNWNAKVMPIAGSSTTEAIVVRAYGYAWKMRDTYNQTDGSEGAFVVATNSSFGINQGQCSNYPLWNAMYDQMGSAGILSCGATTNANLDIDVVGDVPTGCSSSWLITVTNTTSTDTKNQTPGAGWGLTTIDLGAPGTSVLSTTPSNNYELKSGTSMSSPTVAGVVALMFAAASEGTISDYKTDPGSMALQFKAWLLDGVDPITALQGITVTGGRLNARGAVDLVPSHTFEFINRIEGTENFGSLVVDNDDLNPVPSGGDRSFPRNTPHVVRPNDLPFIVNWNGTGNTEKHHRFYAINSDFSLNHSFSAGSETPPLQDANFVRTWQATLTTQVFDLGTSGGGDIELRDPWRYYEDNNDDWFQSNQFLPYPAPFVINNNSLVSYGGVFINQSGPPTWTPPYYSVGALSPQSIGGHSVFFTHWSGTNVTFQNAAATQTGARFNLSGATAIANYKKHLATSNQTAGGPSGQRKVVSFGTTSHCVYESGNAVWYAQRQGSSWTNEVQLSSPEIGAAKNPSIAVTYVAPDVHIHLVWEQTLYVEGDPFQAVVYMRSTNGGSSWQSNWLSDTDDGTWGAYGEDATPVVAGSGSNVVVVWKYDDFYGAGLAWKANPIDWQAAPTRQIRYTDDSRKSPSLDGQTSFKLAYVMSGKIWFDEFNLSGNCGPSSCDVVYVGGGPADLSSEYLWMSSCSNPSVTSNNGNPIFVSWDADNVPSPGTPPISYRNVFVREKVSGVWQPVREFASSVEDINSSTGIDPRNGYQKVNILWQKPTAIAKVSRNLSGGSWSSVSNLGTGYLPTITGINLNNLPPWGMWTTGSAVPYGVTLSDIGGPPPRMEGDIVVTRRASVKLDSLRIGGLEPGSIVGDLIIESPKCEFVVGNQRTQLEFVQDTIHFSDWMGTSSTVVPGGADSIAGNLSVTLQNFQIVNPRVPLGTPVLTVTATVDGDRLNIRLLTIGSLVAFGRSDTTVHYYHKIQARSLRNKSVQIEQFVIGQSVLQDPAWSESYWSEEEEKVLPIAQSLVVVERPNSYALHQNYPNPFNPTTRIEYDLPNDGYVTLKLYDILGKEIANLVDSFKPAGYHEIALDANSLASGIYFYRLSAGSFSDAKKLAIVK